MTVMKNVSFIPSPGTRIGSVCTGRCGIDVCVCRFRKTKIHFVPLPIASGFVLCWVRSSLLFAGSRCSIVFHWTNSIEMHLFVCEKSGGKFFDIKVRMLRMYACASPTRLDGYFVDCLLPLLLLLPHFRSLHQLFPVPFRSSSSPSSPLPVHEKKKWNKLKLKLIKSNKRRFLCFERIAFCFSSGSFCARLRHA